MKHLPNALSITRILLALALLPIAYLTDSGALGTAFMVVYTLAGLTDMVDGRIARKFGWTSKIGANLDGTADYFFILVALVTILPALGLNRLSIGIVIGFVILKVLGMIVGYMHYGQLMMMHTRLSKLGAFVAFLYPIVYVISGLDANTVFIFLGIYVYAFLCEEIAINTIMPYPKRDISGVFEAIRLRKEEKAGKNAGEPGE
jgi:CDP-diacylglycerol--glycerol-3-phosphate 3-phosphatidyltransferase